MAPRRLGPVSWLPLLILPLVAGLLIDAVPPWIFMWVLAGSIFLACKWLVLCEAETSRGEASQTRKLAFLFAWPGMDARAFLWKGPCRKSAGFEWAFAIGKTAFGAILYWLIARRFGGGLLTAWVGMIGLIFMLHFGSFHLLALAWRRAGVCVEPLMNNPAASVSLGEFWSRRWNVAFNEIAERFVFRPFARPWGTGLATGAAFLASGLIHDAVISIPARGGYGLPTLYFLLQALGVRMERSRAGRAAGLRRGFRGWLFTMLVTAGPAYLLFHPPFARQIVLPMMSATHAL